MNETKEGGEQLRDITNEYLGRSPEEFKAFLKSLKGQPALIKINVADFAPDLIEFIADPNHRVKLIGTAAELSKFRQDFPQAAQLVEFE